MNAGTLDIRPWLEKMNKLSSLTGQEMKDVMRQEAALFVWNSNKIPGIINITPPFSDRDKRGQAAFMSGKAKIDRDLAAVFQPVQIKGQRTITKAFGRQLKQPVTVPTKERWPDVAGIARERWKRKNERGQHVMSRGQKSAYYVDESKLEVVRRESYALVGLACSAWYVAAQKCDPPLVIAGVPSWITRHKNPFAAGSITVTDQSIKIVLASSLPYNTALGMAEKVSRVLGYRQGALERRLPYVLRAAIKKANAA